MLWSNVYNPLESTDVEEYEISRHMPDLLEGIAVGWEEESHQMQMNPGDLCRSSCRKSKYTVGQRF